MQLIFNRFYSISDVKIFSKLPFVPHPEPSETEKHDCPDKSKIGLSN